MTISASPDHGHEAGAIKRLAALAPLTQEELRALRDTAHFASTIAPQTEILPEAIVLTERKILLSGWAYRMRQMIDGRRQILGLLLPGDLIGNCVHPNPVSATAIVSVTQMRISTAPAVTSKGLQDAYATSGALDEYALLRQVARLGRLSAYERVIDFLLEIRERLALADFLEDERFPLPLTQEMLADLLGLTTVHVNRTLQTLRQEGILVLRQGYARLSDPGALMKLVDYRPSPIGRENLRLSGA